MRSLLILALGLAVAVAAPSNPQRIVGGSITSIDQYPMAVVMLFASLGSQNFLQSCGGSIINNRSILSAAHCFYFSLGNIHIQHRTFQWRARVGSTYAHSGGVVHTIATFISHPQYNARYSQDHDIAIVRITSPFSMNNNVRPGAIPGPNYKLLDNEVVWAIGWGQLASDNYDLTEELRHVQVWTVNQTVCNTIYGGIVTDNMLCSGWLDVGGRDQCQGDSGGPLLHNNVIVGVSSWGNGCGEKDYPGVNTRVSRYSNWIQSSS